MSFFHSSQLPRGVYIPKSVNGKCRVDDKAARMAAEAKAERDCYRAVDKRDGMRSRLSGVQLALSGSMLKKVVRHHIIFRSQGGPHETWNVLTVTKQEHDSIHVKGTLRVSGDADIRNDRGKLAGVLVEKLTDHGWRAVGMV